MARDHRFIQNLGELHKYFYNKIRIFLLIETYSDLWNNDVGRFWFTHESRKIPVVSLTDTGAYRCWTILCIISQQSIVDSVQSSLRSFYPLYVLF